MHTHAHPRPQHATRKVALLAGGAAVAAAVFLLAGGPARAASPLPAHVHVDGDATAGTTSTIAFRVPTESDTASTVSISVDVPADALITSASALAKPGWDVEIVKTDLATPVTQGNLQIKSDITKVVWTATDGGIPPEEYDAFTLRLAVPSAGTLTLPVHQGYSDGTVVDWADAPNADGSEPAHPAPTLDVAAADAAEGDGTTADDDGLTQRLAIGALVVSILALLAAVVSFATRRRR